MTVVCLTAKHNAVCRFLKGRIHYASHGVPVEASDCSASIRGNMVTPLGHLSIVTNCPCILLISIFQICLIGTVQWEVTKQHIAGDFIT